MIDDSTVAANARAFVHASIALDEAERIEHIGGEGATHQKRRSLRTNTLKARNRYRKAYQALIDAVRAEER